MRLGVVESLLTQTPPQLSTMATLTGALPHVSDPDPKRKLDELDAKLSAFKAATSTEKPHQEEHYSQAQVAWRMVTEMVAGLGIGFGIGYGLDALLGTSPFLMVVFALLGIAAGIKVMLRTAKEMQAQQVLGNGAGTGPATGEAGQTGADIGSPPSEARERTRDGD